MTSSGPNSPGTMANDTTVGTVTWLNPDDAKTSNDVRSHCDIPINAKSYYLKATNFGFAIPTDATVVGVLGETERRCNVNDYIRDWSVKLCKAGTIGGSDKALATAWTTTDTYAQYGGAADLWGNTLTPSDVNNSGFGYGHSAKNQENTDARTPYIDHMRLTVYYTAVVAKDWTDSGTGTEAVTIEKKRFLTVADDGAGAETVAVEKTRHVEITDTAIGIDVAYRVQGEISLDAVALPHVLNITVEEPSIVQDLPVMDALPHRKQRGKQGRRIAIRGWTDLLSTLETLRGYADGETHLLLLPTGDSMNVHVTDVRRPDDVQRYDRYDYEMDALEVVD